MRMQQAGIIDPRALQQARQNPRVQMAEGLASSGIAGALKELIDDRVTMEAMELVAAADRDEAAKMTDKPSIKDSNTQGINQLVQTLAPGMQLRNNQIQKAQMQKMLGLGGQPAPNMRMADGGIVGFEEGGSTGRDFTRGNNFSRHEFMYGPILRQLGIGPMYDFGGGLNEDFMNRRKKRAAVEKYGPDAAMPVGSNQPIPMLMQKYGSKRVMEFFDRQKELKEESKSVAPEYRDAFNNKEALFISDFSDMLEDINQAQSGPLDISEEAGMGLSPMAPIPTPLNAIRRPQRGSKMAEGGIVALKEGGFPDLSGDGKVTQKDILMGRGVVDKAQGGIVGFNEGLSVTGSSGVGRYVPQVGIFGPAIYDFTDFLLSKGIENISDLSSSAIESLTREFEEQKAAGDARAALADMGDAPGSRGTPQARADKVTTTDFPEIPAYLYEASPEELASTDREQRALEDREIDFLNKVSGESDRMAALNYGINPENARMNPPNLNIPNLNIAGNIKDFVEESGLGSLDYEGFARSILPKATDVSTKSTDPSLGRYLGAFTSDMFTGPSRAIDAIVGSDFITDVQEGYYGEEPGTRDDAEIATDVIQTSPTREEPTTTPDNVEKPSRREIDLAAVEAMKSEEFPIEVGPETFRTEAFQETLELDPSTTGYEEKLDEIMQRANSPTRILATFLQGVGEGKTIGQGLMAGGKAIAAAERAYDAQEIQLRGLLEQQRISQQNFNINMQKIANEKEQLRILEDRYITQGKNEAARVKATEKYYQVLASGQTTGLQTALIDALVAYEGSTLYYQDLADELGVDVTDLDRVKNRQAVQDAQSRIRENYRQRLLSGSRTSAGAGTNINTALPEGVTVTRQD